MVFLTCHFLILSNSCPPSLQPSLPSHPQIRLFQWTACTCHLNFSLISQKVWSFFFSPCHVCTVQQWWQWTCFPACRLLIPAQPGRKHWWLNLHSGQDTRKERERWILAICFSKRSGSSSGKLYDNRKSSTVPRKMPEVRSQCWPYTSCLQRGT